MDFFITFLMIPAILAVVGLIGGIVFFVVFGKNKKKIFMISGILAFAVAVVCILYIAGFILIYLIGGSLFGEGSLPPENRSDYTNEAAYQKENDNNNNEDYVKIISVTPNAFIFGEETEFTVEIEYNLVSFPDAILCVGLTDERSFGLMNPSSLEIIDYFPDDRVEMLMAGKHRITLTFTDILEQTEYRGGSVSELNGMSAAIMGFDYPVADYYELTGN
jgi:hypothetical protein